MEGRVPETLTIANNISATGPAIDVRGLKYATLYVRAITGTWAWEISPDGTNWYATGISITAVSTYNVLGNPYYYTAGQYLAIMTHLRLKNLVAGNVTADLCYIRR